MTLRVKELKDVLKGNVLLIEKYDENKRVGYCGIALSDLVSKLYVPVHKAVSVYNIWVDESYRGRGLGEELMRSALELAKERGSAVLEIKDVLRESMGFYERSLRKALEEGVIHDYVILKDTVPLEIHVFLKSPEDAINQQ